MTARRLCQVASGKVWSLGYHTPEKVIAGVKIAILYSGSEDAYRFFIAVSLNLFVRLRKIESRGRNRARIGSK